VVAARMEDIGAALAKLDPESRALLDLSVRRGLDDEDIAAVLRTEVDQVARRRDAILDGLATELKFDEREQRDELFATLQDLPGGYWRGQAARA
jgi:DNA-directed RNA polymerase specialized sigma24 family protein